MDQDNGKVIKFLTMPTRGSNDNGRVMHRFPTVYRAEGFTYTKPRKRKGVQRLPKLKPLPVGYTFADNLDDVSEEVLKPSWTPITKLDPKLDFGWVIVRHHPDESHLIGFIKDQFDWFYYPDDLLALSFVTETEHGIFSLTHRAPADKAPSNLLIHIYSPLVEERCTIEEMLKAPDCYTIYHPDGTVTDSNKLLFPFIDLLFKKPQLKK